MNQESSYINHGRPVPKRPGVKAHAHATFASVFAIALVFGGMSISLSGPAKAAPSGVNMPTGDISGWHQVYADDFTSSTIDPHWSLYNGQYGGGVPHYASNTHVYNSGGEMHLLGQSDASSWNGTQWYTGGACLCAGSDAWTSQTSVMTTFRWRVVNTGLVSSYNPKYAYLRWPDSEVWPRDGEEDFLEGDLAASAGTSFTLHHAGANNSDVNSPQYSVAYDPTAWHTVTYQRSGYHVTLIVDGATKVDYTGSETTLPSALKHIVFQQECSYSGCPTAGTSDVQFDWVTVYVAGPVITTAPVATATPTPAPITTTTPKVTAPVSRTTPSPTPKAATKTSGATPTPVPSGASSSSPAPGTSPSLTPALAVPGKGSSSGGGSSTTSATGTSIASILSSKTGKIAGISIGLLVVVGIIGAIVYRVTLRYTHRKVVAVVEQTQIVPVVSASQVVYPSNWPNTPQPPTQK